MAGGSAVHQFHLHHLPPLSACDLGGAGGHKDGHSEEATHCDTGTVANAAERGLAGGRLWAGSDLGL